MGSFIERSRAVYFNSFGIEYIPREVLNKIKANQLLTICLETIICESYCIAFTEYMLRRKTLLDYTNLFFPKDYEKNDKITYKYSKANMPEEASL